MEPPDTMPNSEVKRRRADGSVIFGHVRVGHRQLILSGLVVQLVRIHACHAWGRGFESRPDRHLSQELS